MDPLLVVAIVTVSGLIAILHYRVRRVDPSPEFVSQQWLAEYRASHAP